MNIELKNLRMIILVSYLVPHIAINELDDVVNASLGMCIVVIILDATYIEPPYSNRFVSNTFLRFEQTPIPLAIVQCTRDIVSVRYMNEKHRGQGHTFKYISLKVSKPNLVTRLNRTTYMSDVWLCGDLRLGTNDVMCVRNIVTFRYNNQHDWVGLHGYLKHYGDSSS
jgi:hypothetical protein